MASYVYFARHSRLPALKIGKGNVVENRLREIGIDYFNVKPSFALEVADEVEANNLERIFHRIFKDKKWKDPTDLPLDGIHEWFSMECLNSIDALFEALGSHIEHKKIPITLSEKPFLQEHSPKPQKKQLIEEVIHPSELDGVVYSVTRLSEMLDVVKNEHPDVLITYLENGNIQFKNFPDSFIPFADSLQSETAYKWREKRGKAIWEGKDSAVRVVSKSYRPMVGASSAECLPMEKIWLKLFWGSFPSENLPDSLTNFIGRWPSLPLPITSSVGYALVP